MFGGGISLVMAIMVKNRPNRFIEADEGRAAQAAEARSSTALAKKFKVGFDNFKVFRARRRGLVS